MDVDQWLQQLGQLNESVNTLTDGALFMDQTDRQIIALYGNKLSQTVERMQGLGDDYRENRRQQMRGSSSPEQHQEQEQEPQQQQPTPRVTPSVPPGRRR